ncbi:hypothetical protein GCM10027446_07070 [Angustibacter peucedani]
MGPATGALASTTAPSTPVTPAGTTTPTEPPSGTASPSPTGSPTSTASPSTTTGPSGSTTATPTRTGTATSTQTGTTTVAPPPEKPHDEDPLTPEQVAEQLAQAAALSAQRRATAAGLQAALEQLQAVGAQISTALDDLGQARATEADAQRVRQANLDLLSRLQGDLTVQRDALGQWARDTYAVGGPMATYEGWLVALEGDSTGAVAHDLSVLQEIGVAGGRAVQRLQDSVQVQAQATQQAALAAARAQAARARATAALTRLRSLQQQAQLATAQLELQQAHLVGTGRLSAQQQANLAAAEAVVKAAGHAPASGCRGLPTAGYPNGTIPTAALCPVWGAPTALLRADAAAALTRLSHQYAAQFGTPLCLTDSYRSLAAQVAVYAAKPALAAKPGTSNHGWGVAVDLCGGVQSFGTEQHAWMLAHAPLLGWFHPAWAGPAGSRPEPWHWEFAG